MLQLPSSIKKEKHRKMFWKVTMATIFDCGLIDEQRLIDYKQSNEHYKDAKFIRKVSGNVGTKKEWCDIADVAVDHLIANRANMTEDDIAPIMLLSIKQF